MRPLLLPALLALGLSGQSPAQDIHGRNWQLFAPPEGIVHVLVFVSTDCPISNRYAPELARIQQEYAPKGVRVMLVYEDPAADTATVRQHLGEFYPSAPLPAFVDRERALARAAGATVTPTAVLYTTDGRRYRGRIDDLYVAIGKTRREPTERTLRLSLDAVLAGRPVPAPVTTTIGCYIGGAS